MDSFNLMTINKKEKKPFFQNKKIIMMQFNNILLIIIFIFIILIIYIFNLKRNFDKNSLKKEKYNKIFEKKNDDNIIENYVKQQNKFCDSFTNYNNSKYEELIKLSNFSFKGLSYQIYIYIKNDNHISNRIIKTGKFEPNAMSNFLKALKYYGKIKNILNNKDIYVLDIGGNIGAHTSFLGKFGYSILTFEASPRNYYILNKNYCLINRNSNIVLINKGVSNEERTCNYYSQMDGIGNGILLCNEKKKMIKAIGYYFKKTFEVNLIKLNSFIPFFSNKNLALIKLDIEGGEGKAIEAGIEFINKIHVPFIFSEFCPKLLEKHGTNPKKYIQFFIDNGYKISKKGFFSKSFITNYDEIKNGTDLFFIYNQI